MTKKVVGLVILVGLISVSGFSQVVPDEMYFADIHLKLTNGLRAELQQEVDELTKSPKYFQIKVDRANLYFPIIEQIFQEERLPDDFKYLVLQESALIADAVSVSNAVGFWQFKEFTAKEMGLRVDRQIDERMNIVSSTRAAAGYMRKNNFYFDNWLHALQAYQMGAGGAMKALSDKYYGKKKMTLDNKTYWYVKKFLAHKIAFQYAVDPEKSQVHLIEYSTNENTSLKEIAGETYIDHELLSEYNKWVRKEKIPGDMSFSVILPVDGGFTSPVLASNESYHEESESVVVTDNSSYSGISENATGYPKIKDVKNTEYKKINGIPGIIAGSSLSFSQIEGSYGVSEIKFRKYNEILPHEEITAGGIYYLKPKKGKAKEFYHILQEDETVWQVSQLYGVKLKKLLQKNRLKDPSEAQPGLVLWLRNIRPSSVAPEFKEVPNIEQDPVEKETDQTSEELDSSIASDPGDEVSAIPISLSAEDTVMYHMTRKGETLYSISKQYGVGVMEIVNQNDLDLQAPLSVGRNLRIETTKSNIKQETAVDNAESITSVAGSDVVLEVESSSENTALDAQTEVIASKDTVEYIVQQGDTYYKISREFGVKVHQIKAWNNKENDYLTPGEKLVILKE